MLGLVPTWGGSIGLSISSLGSLLLHSFLINVWASSKATKTRVMLRYAPKQSTQYYWSAYCLLEHVIEDPICGFIFLKERFIEPFYIITVFRGYCHFVFLHAIIYTKHSIFDQFCPSSNEIMTKSSQFNAKQCSSSEMVGSLTDRASYISLSPFKLLQLLGIHCVPFFLTLLLSLCSLSSFILSKAIL